MTLKKRSVDDGIGDVPSPMPLATSAASLVISARELYVRGNFPECVAVLEGQTFMDDRWRSEAVFLLSRALIRLQRSSAVVELLGPIMSTFATADEVSTARMLFGTAVARDQSVDLGLQVLADAASFAKSKKSHRAIQAEIAYYRGAACWTKRDYIEASRYARLAERAKLDILSVRAIQLRGFIALACADFNKALRLFYRARRAYSLCHGRDFGLATTIIHQIAFLEMNLRSAQITGSHADPVGRTIPGASFGPAVATPARMLMICADAVDPVAAKLTPAQRDVLRRLLDGKSPVEISEETNRAHSTVQTHIHHIHVAFGTHFERQLFAECNRRGIGSPALVRRAEVEASRRTS